MKLSHLLYKVDNLYESVNNFKEKGFNVEFGSKHNPKNALIYFSKGPYIELIEKAPISLFERFGLRIIGKRFLLDRFNFWEGSKKGFFGICLENYENDFLKEMKILKKYNEIFFETKSQRLDPKGRHLKWKLLFPSNIDIPFFMTYFNIDPKPIKFVHPNGIKNIKKVNLGVTTDLISIINELCDDSILNLNNENEISVEYQYDIDKAHK